MIGDYNLNAAPIKQKKQEPEWASRSTEYATVRNGQRIKLPPEDVREEFIKLYPNSFNDELAKFLGRSEWYVTKLAQFLGLKKSPEHRSEIRARVAASEKTKEKYRLQSERMKGRIKDELKPYLFKANIQALPPEERERQLAIKRKAGKTLAKVYAKERLRVKWGLPQQTDLRVVAQPKAKIRIKCKLKRFGYTYTGDGVFIAPGEEVRKAHRIVEKNAAKYFKIYTLQEYEQLKAG